MLTMKQFEASPQLSAKALRQVKARTPRSPAVEAPKTDSIERKRIGLPSLVSKALTKLEANDFEGGEVLSVTDKNVKLSPFSKHVTLVTEVVGWKVGSVAGRTRDGDVSCGVYLLADGRIARQPVSLNEIGVPQILSDEVIGAAYDGISNMIQHI